MKPIFAIAFTALLILGCPQNLKAQEKTTKTVGQYQIPTVNKPKPPIFPTTDQLEINSIGPLTLEKRTKLSPFDPLAHPKYKFGLMLKIPASNVAVAPSYGPCNRPKNAPQEFSRCKQISFGAKVDLTKKPTKINPGGKFGSFK